MVSDLSMGFRAKSGDIWSLCNHVGPSKHSRNLELSSFAYFARNR